MKAYLIVTGIVFALLVGLHAAKAVAEGEATAKDPHFILFTVASAALSFWAWWLLAGGRRSR